MKELIVAFVVVLVGLVLSPVITTQAAASAAAATAANQTTAALFYNLIPFGWAIGIFLVSLAIVWHALKGN